MNIKIDLVEITAEDVRHKEARSSNTREHNETTPAEFFALDVIAPRAIAQLLEEQGNQKQRTNAPKLAREWLESCAQIGGALWFCGDSATAAACNLNGWRLRAVGWVRGLVLPVLFLEDKKEEEERAFLIRFDW